MKNLFSFILLLPFFAQAQVITNIAGNGIAGFSGDGGAATAAKLNIPQGIIFDASDNLIFADYNNNRIRKINTSGIITTIAGTGSPVFFGDGGPASAAGLNNPTGLAIDVAGNIYVADQGNHCIRKINSSGIISTVAGVGASGGYNGDGILATAAKLSTPYGLTFDNSGNIIIADLGNNRIRKIDAVGIITTIAGTGTPSFSGDGAAATAATLFNPSGVAIDTAGNLFIADRRNQRLRKVNTSGIISTVAGTGTSTYTGDGGAATAAALNNPYNVFTDTLGNVYVADQANNRIRIINTAGIINTFAGNGIGGFSGDGGPATAAELNAPWILTKDNSGNFYIADQVNSRIRKIDCNMPYAGSITGSSTLCIDSMTTFADTATSGFWTAANLHALISSGSGIAFGVTAGVDTIFYTVSNSCGTYTTEKEVTIVACTSGIPIQTESNTGCIIFPNPTNDVLAIKADHQQYQSYTISNTLGEVVASGSLSDDRTQISMRTLPANAYYIRLIGSGGSVVKRVVKM